MEPKSTTSETPQRSPLFAITYEAPMGLTSMSGQLLCAIRLTVLARPTHSARAIEFLLMALSWVPDGCRAAHAAAHEGGGDAAGLRSPVTARRAWLHGAPKEEAGGRAARMFPP